MKRNINMLRTAVLAAVACLTAGLVQAATGAVAPLVSTQWVADNLSTIRDTGQARIRLIEVSAKGYDKGHIPGAVHMKWGRDTFDPTTDHMVLGLDQIERLMSRLAAPPSTHIVIYGGDGKPHFPARVYWTLKYWNYNKVSIMDGGKKKWLAEKREMTSVVPAIVPQGVTVAYPPNTSIRAQYSPDVISALATGKSIILDSRPERFYDGREYALNKWIRNGHITGAQNVPALAAMAEDNTYMKKEELQELYEEIPADKPVITYCDTGVLGAHAWFVMHELLGYTNVRLYDGSMREYANRFDTPMVPGTVYGKVPPGPIALVGRNCPPPETVAATP
ncbi:sulfurtransferase [Desulfolithobacter dissulfuricans]|uniref:Sulfurtransferase n=1 Tax=Desulfolithobacter dissulfuricans TaxID=2795293 RepID=A0A915TYU5_9BACT|nr:sulfurtransferase [Desulfolithobacter dissulfuricans]BCO08298.1 sulfurtransferase [Desulfolithobacter dissulfuricans]